MPRDNINMSEAELEIMKVLWKSKEPLTAQDVSDALVGNEWKYSTIATLFSRMVEKGTATYEKKGRFHYYVPTISEKEYKEVQTQKFISKLYNGSVKNLVVSLAENKQLSDDDIEEIKNIFNI